MKDEERNQNWVGISCNLSEIARCGPISNLNKIILIKKKYSRKTGRTQNHA